MLYQIEFVKKILWINGVDIQMKGENNSQLLLFKMFYTAICMRKMCKCHSNLT